MSDRFDFTIEIHQNQYLPAGDTQVHAIVRVEAVGDPVAVVGRPANAAEVIIIDTSGSMVGERLVAAKRAAKTAVDGLREDVHFAVIGGSERATMIYPRERSLAPATAGNRTEAKTAVAKLSASGGTRMGHWLALAGQLFGDHPEGIRHAILLTDGKNEPENRQQLDDVLAACAGRFVCHCRGVGTDWEAAELRRIATALQGSADIVADPRDLAADFATMIAKVMGPAIADVILRIWTPNKATLRYVKQVLPSVQELSGMRVEAGPRQDGPVARDYPTGIWSAERRDYHVCVTVPAGQPYEHMLAARVSLVLPDSGQSSAATLARGDVLAEWTDDEAQSTRIHPWVEHYSKQEELADSVQLGLGARKKGDLDAAGREFGRAVGLARETGNEETFSRLGNVVAVDPATGAARPREDVDKAHEMELDLKSGASVKPPAEPTGPPHDKSPHHESPRDP